MLGPFIVARDEHIRLPVGETRIDHVRITDDVECLDHLRRRKPTLHLFTCRVREAYDQLRWLALGHETQRVGWIDDDPHAPVQCGLEIAGLVRAGIPRADRHFVTLAGKPSGKHPAPKGKLTLQRIAALDHLLVSPRGGRQGIVDAQLGRLGLTRPVALSVPHFLMAPAVVAESDLIATLPRA